VLNSNCQHYQMLNHMVVLHLFSDMHLPSPQIDSLNVCHF
jgi:hypothetical protein